MSTKTAQAPNRQTMSGTRVVVAIVLSAAGFVVGFYLGIFMLLSIVGLDDFEGWQFELATIPVGSIVAGLGAAVAAPRTGRVVGTALGAAAVAAAVSTPVLFALDGDFAVAIILGGVVAVIATVAATVGASRRR